MPLKIKLTSGADTFEVEGDFTFNPEFLSVVQAWSRTIGPAPEQSDVDALTEALREQNDRLEATVTQFPVNPPPQ